MFWILAEWTLWAVEPWQDSALFYIQYLVTLFCMSLFCSKKLLFWSFYLPVMTNVTLYIILFFFLKFSVIQILPRLRNQHRLWVEICLKSKGIQVKELPQWELLGLGSSLILGSWRESPAFVPPLLQHRIVLMRSTKYHWLLV